MYKLVTKLLRQHIGNFGCYMLDKQFRFLGFTNNEARIYLSLAEIGKSTAQLLAKRIKIPRTTAYSVLQGLIEKGVISEEHTQGTTFYVLNQPASLLRLIEREKETLKAKESAAKNLIEFIKPYLKSKLFSIPKIQFFEGSASIESMLYDMTSDWIRSIETTDKVWWGYQDASFVDVHKKWLEHAWSEINKKIQIQILSTESKTEKILKDKIQGRTIKFIPKEYDFSSTIWVCGEYIVLLMTRQQPVYGFQIKDAVFASNLRLVFKLLWGSLPQSK